MNNDLVPLTQQLLETATSPFAAPASIGAVPGQLQSRLLTEIASPLVKERWKYTRLNRHLTGGETQARGAHDAVSINLNNAGPASLGDLAELATTNLSLAQRLNTYFSNSPHWARYPLADLAAALSSSAQVLQVTGDLEGSVDVELTAGMGFAVVYLAQGARATINLTYAPGADFGNHWLLYYQEANSELNLTTVLNGEQDSNRWLLNHVQLQRNAIFNGYQYAIPAGEQRTETQVDLQAPEARANLLGAAVVQTGARLDQQNTLEHQAPHCTSDQRFHVIAGDKGRSTFNGRIHIHPAAQQTNAHLQNRNLSLDHSAVINTKPELEIYADDVRCSHGATIGQLDEEALFYLRSRGMPIQQARQVLLRAFIAQTVQGPCAESVGELLNRELR